MKSVRWSHNWLDHHDQKVVISGEKALNGVLKGYVPWLVPFNIFLNDVKGWPGCTIRKYAGDTNLWMIFRIRIQKEFNKLETSLKLIDFNKEKCKISHWGWNKHMHKYILESNFLVAVQ